MGELTGAAKTALFRQLFGMYVNLQLDYEMMEELGPTFQYEDFYNGFGNEPTEMLVKGFTPETVIKLAEEINEIIVPVRGDNNSWDGPMKVEDFAQQLFYAERPDLFPWMVDPNNQSMKFTRCRIANRRTIEVKLKLSKFAHVSETLEERDYTVSEPISIKNLPDRMKKVIAERLVKLREEYKDMKPGMFTAPARGGSGGIIPPSR